MSARKYTGGPAPRLCLALLLALLWLSAPLALDGPGAGWRPAPDYVRLFTAAATYPDAYRAFVTDRPLHDALRDQASDPAILRPPGSWTPQPVIALDAFGKQGRYNRWELALLYGATRPRVARGPRGENGRVAEAWTLISPYPDPSLRWLEPGTLLLVLHLP